MMLSSLRARLWLSYALLIGLMLAVVGAALLISLLRNPQVYRAQLPRLRAAEQQALPLLNQLLDRNNLDRLQKAVSRAAENLDLRLIVTDPSGKVIADSSKGLVFTWTAFDPNQLAELPDAARPDIIRDRRGRAWIFSAAGMENGAYLVVLQPVASLPVVSLLRNEVITPLLVAGIIAVFVATALAIGMGRWISAPLQRMVGASRNLAQGKEITIPVEGPDEVKELARAMNEMSRQVRSGQQSQRDFVANVSHELKTPLTSIQGFAQAILDGAAATPEALRQSAEVIYAESTRMYRLVLELLTLARLEAGTADLQRAPVNLSLLLNSIASRFTLQAQTAQVSLLCTVPDGLVMLGDGDRLAQVFTNLIENALKFTPTGGRVEIIALAAEGSITVAVNDTGKGIQKQDQERIFERFYQTDKARKGGSERGVGLGLPIAHQIVLAHGGRLWVESQPDQGSHFMVKLPQTRSDHSSAAPQPAGRN